MRITPKFYFSIMTLLFLSSCVSKKQFANLQSELDSANRSHEETKKSLVKANENLVDFRDRLSACDTENARLRAELGGQENTDQVRQQQIQDLRAQLADCRDQRNRQVEQVGNLTVLNQSANDNMRETLSQLERKDKYIHLLQAARTKADSINLALSVNLKNVLKDGIEDQDVDIKVDKTVVFVNLSDKMLYQSGSSNLTPRAHEVLEKIASIVSSRPDLEVMVEGYTDNVPINTDCISDNWDLSVKRATSVVRVLQSKYKLDPNRLIAAGRGQYNILASNDTASGRATNRRTRIIILPKLDQFYDLLNPNNIPAN